MLEFENVNKSYWVGTQRKVILNRASFSVELGKSMSIFSQNAQTSLETARAAADRQVRFLAQAIPHVAPDDPTYPRTFENTVLALLIFGGIYLMMSPTASILREQV